MSNETGPSNFSSEGGEGADFAVWEQELAADDFAAWEQELSPNNSARLAIELGETALGQFTAPEQTPRTYPVEEYFRLEKPSHKEHASPEQAMSHSGDFRLTGDDMCQIALGLIYFTTGVPAEEVYK